MILTSIMIINGWVAGALFTDGDPDLRKFKAAGAKLIVAQGGSDLR